MSILVIDDSEDIHLLIEKFLLKAGYKDFTFSKSAKEAYIHLGLKNSEEKSPERCSKKFDLIILDILMEGIDGIEACAFIKESECYKDTPIMMITGDHSDEVLQRAFDAGANDFITKPIRGIEFMARVNSALNLKREKDFRKDKEIKLEKTTKQLQTANEVLQGLYTTDPLTNINNRGHFDVLLAAEWKRAKRDGLVISLIMIDVDYFKAFNDAYGHLGGDNCLIQVADCIASELKRPADFCARYGGEEFTVVLPNTDLEGTKHIAEDIRKAVQDLKIDHKTSDAGPFVTISCGVTAMIPDMDTLPEKLISLADLALYKAKKSGRNCVKVNE